MRDCHNNALFKEYIMNIDEEYNRLSDMMSQFGREFAIKTLTESYKQILNEFADQIEEDWAEQKYQSQIAE